jgi:hypothetical protein
VLGLGLFPTSQHEAYWVGGLALFAPGVFDAVDTLVDRNLTGAFRRWHGPRPKALLPFTPQGRAPLPMTFVRAIGPELEQGASFQWTRSGSIKVTLSSSDELFAETDHAVTATRWGKTYPPYERSGGGPGKKKATARKKKAGRRGSRT